MAGATGSGDSAGEARGDGQTQHGRPRPSRPSRYASHLRDREACSSGAKFASSTTSQRSPAPPTKQSIVQRPGCVPTVGCDTHGTLLQPRGQARSTQRRHRPPRRPPCSLPRPLQYRRPRWRRPGRHRPPHAACRRVDPGALAHGSSLRRRLRTRCTPKQCTQDRRPGSGFVLAHACVCVCVCAARVCLVLAKQLVFIGLGQLRPRPRPHSCPTQPARPRPTFCALVTHRCLPVGAPARRNGARRAVARPWDHQ